jgi:hypothetical protein
VGIVKMRMEAAIVYKHTRLSEAQRYLSRLAAIAFRSRKQRVHPFVTGGGKEIIAHDRMIVRIIVDPGDLVSNLDGHDKGIEAILFGYRHHVRSGTICQRRASRHKQCQNQNSCSDNCDGFSRSDKPKHTYLHTLQTIKRIRH